MVIAEKRQGRETQVTTAVGLHLWQILSRFQISRDICNSFISFLSHSTPDLHSTLANSILSLIRLNSEMRVWTGGLATQQDVQPCLLYPAKCAFCLCLAVTPYQDI
jgi:hypothetical protein